MNEIFAGGIILSFGLTVSNFLFQHITSKNWEQAIERSWFQTTAVLIFATLLSIR